MPRFLLTDIENFTTILIDLVAKGQIQSVVLLDIVNQFVI